MKKIRIRISARHGAAVAGLVVAGSLLAACGGGGSSGSSTPVGAAASATSTGGSNSAYFACLSQHGVTIPSRSPGQGRPSGRPSGGFGGFGGGGGGFSQSPQMQAALQACSSLRPSGGAFPGGGGFGGRGGTALTAFRNCMTQQGVTIPTTRPTARPTASSTDNAARFYLGGLDPNDPKVSAALKVCSPLLPSRGASAQPTS
ncbi:MAG TPA: hypothetical protein VFU73_05030 [Actinocrinis sp.]|nr:hypothetical protein [Actinocrinis sp.]